MVVRVVAGDLPDREVEAIVLLEPPCDPGRSAETCPAVDAGTRGRTGRGGPHHHDLMQPLRERMPVVVSRSGWDPR